MCFIYDQDSHSLTKSFEITSGIIGAFTMVLSAKTDAYNNLWFVDRITQRVMRINFSEQRVDYDLVYSQVMDVVPHPINGSAYISCIKDPEQNNLDTIRFIKDINTLRTEFLFTIPGQNYDSLYEYAFNGHITAELSNHIWYRNVYSDPVWGIDGSLEWQPYPNASLGLPKGLYKQLRVTLQRDSTSTTSPYLRQIRIPEPLLLDSIPWKGYKNIYIDTDLSTGASAGEYNMDLLVWWPQT